MRNRLMIAVAIACLTLTGALAWSNSSPSSGGYSGGPGDDLCNDCHFGGSGFGSTSLDGPDIYTLNQTLDFTITTRDASAMRWGFSVLALDSNNSQVGNLVATDAVNTQKFTDGIPARQHIMHTLAGTFASQTDSAMWQFQWQAPAAYEGEVTFYVGSLAADNNGSASGGVDITYSTVKMLTASPSDVAEVDNRNLPGGFHLSANYPNPFNPSTSFYYSLPQRATVQIIVTNVAGQQVRTLFSGEQAAGTYLAEWDGTSDNGSVVATGVYFYTVKSADRSETRKMVFLR